MPILSKTLNKRHGYDEILALRIPNRWLEKIGIKLAPPGYDYDHRSGWYVDIFCIIRGPDGKLTFRAGPLSDLKRFLFGHCEYCKGRFTYGYTPIAGALNPTGPRWFKSERYVYHWTCWEKRDVHYSFEYGGIVSGRS